MIAKSWLSGFWQVKIGACIALTGTFCIAVSGGTLAQIVPDNTLGAESSVVTPDVIGGIESDRIDGGATRGANLFHSFEQFNIGAGRGAYFTNPAGIENIFSRVTGANRSDILGRLGVLGNANLFLINPRGVVFGSGASLDVQGSFIATTADAVKLGDTGLFSATQPEASNLLTVSPSAILFNTIAAQPIINRSQAQSLIEQTNSASDSPGLQVQPGQTLGLVGGNVLIEGGNLTAAGGRIELGSVAGVGEVSLTGSGNFELGYDAIADFGNISLSNEAFVDASGEGGGDVQIRGARLEMSQSSNISADTLGAENGGEVLVRTIEVVLGEDSFLRANVASTGTGTGGNLTIDTGRLVVRAGSQVSVATSGQGKGGNLQINARDSVEMVGESAKGEFFSGLYASSLGSGNAGDVTIDTGRLLLQGGAQVSAITEGEGEGGNLQINADDSVEVVGESDDGRFGSNLSVRSNGSGNAGNLKIDTGRLLVQGGAVISSRSSGEGTSGNIKITARETLQADDGTISTSTSRSSGGAIAITAGNIRLVGDSDIRSSVASGADDGGKITLTADSILAFDDSDILAFATDFGENYRPASGGTNSSGLDNNNQVDINATGAINGIITLPDVSFIQNSLVELPENQLNTDTILANSCIVRRNQRARGSFTITGTGGLPQRPGDAQISSFPTVDVATLPSDGTISNTNPNRSWQKGDPIVKPQGVYRLPNGKLVLSRECS